MESEIIIEIIDRLIGDYEPYGETNHDKKSNDNLITLCDVVEHYIDRIYLLRKNKNRVEYSIRASGLFAEEFFENIAYCFEEKDNETN